MKRMQIRATLTVAYVFFYELHLLTLEMGEREREGVISFGLAIWDTI